MDKNKLAIYIGFIFSITINVCITIGLIATRHDRLFWLFIFLLSAFEAYGIMIMYSANISINSTPQHQFSNFDVMNAYGKKDSFCDCDVCRMRDKSFSPPNIKDYALVKPWFDCYMSLSNILLRTRLHNKQIPEEIEAHFATIADMYWNKMTEQEQDTADGMCSRSKEYYDSLSNEMEKERQ